MNRAALLVCLLVVASAAPSVQAAAAVSQPNDSPSAATAGQRDTTVRRGITGRNDTAAPTETYTIALRNHTADTATLEVRIDVSGLNESTQYRAVLRNHRYVQSESVAGVSLETAESGYRYWNLTGNGTTSASVVVTTNNTELVAGAPRIATEVLDLVAVVRPSGRVETARRIRIEGAGLTAGRWAYFGNATVTSITVGGHRVPVVKPAGLDPRTDPAAVAREINRTARSQQFPPPPATLSIWYRAKIEPELSYVDDVAGTGGYDTIDLETSAVGGTVRHEYVHIVQRAEYGNRTTWFVEGSADYIAHVVGVQYNLMRFESFYDEINASQANSTHNLTEQKDVYATGEQVVAALDLRLRRATNGTATVRDVILYLNREAGETVTLPEVYAAVEHVGGRAQATWLRTVIEARRVPPIPEPDAVKAVLVQSQPDADFDADGLSNAAERRHRTDPFVRDTDDDGLNDTRELARNLDPTARDTDGDGLGDKIDPQPRTPTLSSRVKWVGIVVASFSVLSLWITAGVGVIRVVDRLVGIVPDRITSLSLKRLLAVNVGGLLLGGVIYGLGIVLYRVPIG